MKIKFFFYVFILLISLITFFIVFLNSLEKKKDTRLGLNSEVDKYELITHNGKKFNKKFFSKKPSLLFFGFLNCPDICPSTLNTISDLIENLEIKNQEVNFYFVTVDPIRDNRKKIKEYLSHFNPKIIGVTGSEKNINNFLDHMYVFKKKVYYSADEYTYDHSSQIFMFRKDGNFFGTISLNESKINIHKKIDKVINGA
jgi:protein SCO1/2